MIVTLKDHIPAVVILQNAVLGREVEGNVALDVLRSRIQLACSILTTADLSIQQVAQILNYENDTFFYRQIKQQIGISPGEYRKLRIGGQ